MRGIFITGTDTGVGKTVVSAALLLALRGKSIDAGYMKPVATGCVVKDGRLVSPDVQFIREVCDIEDDDGLVSPVVFAPPVDPLTASAMAGRSIEMRVLEDAYEELSGRHGFLVVEGIGGIAVPLGPGFDVCDLISALDLPALVVIRPSLGTINHTILTVDYAMRRGVDVLALVVNSASPGRAAGPAGRTGPELIERKLGIPVIAWLDYAPDFERDPDGSLLRLGPGLADRVAGIFKGWH
ncbi:MAG: dethiobiotin synthase [Candidatus Tritonobacter lacicola]|nr:dethiobiotin synthase [Candidatus Tritonobacter lacicola]